MNGEIERFGRDLATSAGLRNELKTVGKDDEAIVQFANGKGYGFTVEDLQDSKSRNTALSDEQLGQVSGGLGRVLLPAVRRDSWG